MKLKLDAQSGVSVLTVSGSVASTEFEVLKAGLAKLLTEGKSPLIIDLTQATVASEIHPRFPELQAVPAKADSIFVIASPDPTIATAPSRAECLQILSSPAAKLLAQEAKLKSQVAAAKAKARRSEVMKKLDETAALGAEIKKLRRENGDLHLIVVLLEEQIQTQVKTRKPPFISGEIQESLDDVHDVIARVFRPSGLLKGRAG